MQKKLLLSSLILCSFLGAQTLTLESAINKTLKNHPDVKSFTLKVKQSHFSYNSAYADFLPQVNLQANYNGVQTFVFPVNGSFNTLDDDGWSAGASLTQKIWDFSKTTSKVDASKIDEDISKLSLEDLKALLVYKVKSLYELMILQSEAINARKKDLEAKEAYYSQAKAFVNQGLKTQADASRFLSSVFLAKENLSTAQASYLKAKNSLSLYMGEKIPEDTTLQKSLIQNNNPIESSIEEEIFQNNYQLKIYSQNIDKNTLLHKSAKAAHYGSIDALASYTHVDTLNSYDSKLLGVSLNIPLYSGGRISAESQKAAITSQIATQQKASQELLLREETQSLLIDIASYTKTIDAKKAQLISSQETRKVLDARYSEGLSTYIEILDATSLVLNAQLGLLEANYLRSIAINRLQYLKGKIQ
jgi:outer membrane protein TolC